jgi:hypothetical protein
MGARHAAYQYLIWRTSAESVAYAGYGGFMLGWRVVVPGILPPVMALALRAVPHRIMIPIVGWLLRPRRAEAGNAGR